jgi:DNA polymerase-4
VVVEVLGWDEAFLGAQTDDPEALAGDVRRAILEATGLESSVGIGDNKLRAKIATGFAKPAGVYRLTRENWVEVMAHRPVRALWGIGSRMSANLAEEGVRTVADLAKADRDALATRFGPRMGPWYQDLALGAGDSEVTATPWVAKGRGREVTFQENLTDWADVAAEVAKLAHRVADDVAAEGRPVQRVAVKVRYAPFFTKTKIMKLRAGPTSDPTDIERAALVVLGRFEPDRPVRLLGVRIEFERDDT